MEITDLTTGFRHTTASTPVVSPRDALLSAPLPRGLPSKPFRPSMEWGKPLPLTRFFPGCSEEMASQIIEGSIHHVLTSPLSSFYELVTNACDACKEGPPIGQFGMGFFSVLSFLDYGEGCLIEVATRCKSDPPYKITIEKRSETIFVQFDKLPETTPLGTTVTVHKSSAFSERDLRTIQRDLKRLQLMEGVQISILGPLGKQLFGQSECPHVAVSLGHECLVVRDPGSGISLETACRALLVPSSSSRSRPDADEETAPCRFTHYRNDGTPNAHFLVTVNGSVVVDLTLETEYPQDLAISLPQRTALTLDRTSVQFARRGGPTIRALKKIIEGAVAQSIDCPRDLEAHVRLALLHEGLLAWEARAVPPELLSQYLQERVSTALKSRGLTPYPLSHYETLAPILEELGAPNVIPMSLPLLRHDMHPAVRLVKELAERQVSRCPLQSAGLRGELVSVPVIFVADESLPKIGMTRVRRLTDAGLYSCVFAPRSLLKIYEEPASLAFHIATRYSEYGRRLSLAPTLTKHGREVMEGPGLIFGVLDKRKPRVCAKRLQGFLLLAEHDSFATLDDHLLDQFWDKHEAWLQVTLKKTKLLFPLPLRRLDGIERKLVHSSDEAETLDKAYQVRDRGYWRCCWKESEPKLVPVTRADLLRALIAFALHDYKLLQVYRDRERLWPPTSSFTLEQLETLLAATLPIYDKGWPPPPEAMKHARPSTQVGVYVLKDEEPLTPEIIEIASALSPLQEASVLLGGGSVRGDGIRVALFQRSVEMALDDPSHIARVQRMGAFLTGLLQRYYAIPDREFPDRYGSGSSHERAPNRFWIGHYWDQEVADYLISHKEDKRRFDKLIHFLELTYEWRLSPPCRKRRLANRQTLEVPAIVEFGPLAFLAELHGQCGIHPRFLNVLIDCADTPEQLIFGCLVLYLTHFEAEGVLEEGGDTTHAPLIGSDATQREETAELIKSVMIETLASVSNLKDAIQTAVEGFHIGDGSALQPMLNSLRRGKYDIEEREIKPVMNFLLERFSQDSKIERITEITSSVIEEALGDSSPFTAIQLFHAHTDNSVRPHLSRGDLEIARSVIGAASRKSALQIYQGAIESGSARPIEQAFFLEALQNSVDAAGERPEESITFRVALQGSQHVVLSACDSVGFASLDVLLGAFLIPSQSEKRGKATVGQMGNGSFQVYRGAERVIVKTRCLDCPEKLRVLSIRPKRIHGKVCDLSIRCIELDAASIPDFRGTRIDVRLLPKDPENASLFALRALSFLRGVVSQSDTVISLNLELLSGTESIRGHDDREPPLIGSGSPPLRFIRLKGNRRGQLLTGGIPAGDLAEFLTSQRILPASIASQFATGWCLDLPIGSYHAVQSRQSLRLNEARRRELRALVNDWVLHRASFRDSQETAFDQIPHARSSCWLFSQVRPGLPRPKQISLKTTELPAFLLHYRPSFLKQSLNEHLLGAYATIVPKLEKLRADFRALPIRTQKEWGNAEKAFTHRVQSAFATWKAKQLALYSPGDPGHQFVENVLIRWFEPKVADLAQQGLPSLADLKAANPTLRSKAEQRDALAARHEMSAELESSGTSPSAPLRQLSHIAKSGLGAYFDLFAALNGMSSVAVAFAFEPDSTYSAYYSAGRITINVAHVPLSQILYPLCQLAWGVPLSDASDPANLFLVRPGDSGTLNHELEHARRRAACITGGPHDPGRDVEGRVVSFEACAASFARRASRLGVFKGLKDAMNKVLADAELTTSDLRRMIRALQRLEAKNPTEIQEWLRDWLQEAGRP